jgi:hypothetical protein
VRGIFFDEDDAGSAVARLRADGYEASASRERYAGEDDDEDHPWAVETDAPHVVLELLVEEHDGWLDAGDGASTSAPPELPTGPKRHHRSP